MLKGPASQQFLVSTGSRSTALLALTDASVFQLIYLVMQCNDMLRVMAATSNIAIGDRAIRIRIWIWIQFN
jgi:hypothetical protein